MKKFYILIVFMTCFSCKEDKLQIIKLSGPVFGTGFNIQYFDLGNRNYATQIDSLFNVVNQSLSTYIPDSDISRVNKNDSLVEVDEHFKHVLKSSKAIYRATEGVFDPTIGNVVNAWNFGAETNKFLTDSTTIDSLMQFVGLNRVGLVGNRIKKPKSGYLEFNAIAKGYGVDVIAEFLKSQNVENYLVEIGGEVRTLGVNIEKAKPWKVGLQRPRFDGISDPNDYVLAVPLKNEAMATSGSYRKFKVDENGNRYTHIINTKTGYPTKTNVLSVSVIAEDCMKADAYATAFQVMGVEKVKTFLNTHPELKVYFIYEASSKEMKTLALNGFPE